MNKLNSRLILSWVGSVLLCGGLSPASVVAQGLSAREAVEQVGVDQKLDAQVPGEIRLFDESGKIVRLKDFYGDKPILLNLVYFECPMLCNMTMDGLLRSLKGLPLDVGDDFTVLTVSFDPREGPPLAAKARQTALKRYERPGADKGWRFLTGQERELKKLTDSVGFRYVFDAYRGEYAHAATLIVLTPTGKVSRYLTGVEFPERDLRLSLVEASNHQIGSPLDQAILLCFHYDPTTGRYGLAVMNLIRILGAATVLGLAVAVFTYLRRERRATHVLTPGSA